MAGPLRQSSASDKRAAGAITTARSALARGDHDGAIASLKNAARQLPTNASIWFALGDACARAKRYEAACASLRQACAIAPADARYRIALADALFLGGMKEEALTEYLRATELDANNVSAWANAGAILQQLGQHEQALGALNRALALDPKHAMALNNTGLAFSELGEFAMARECLSMAVDAKPDYEAARWNRAILDLLHGDYARGWEGHELRHVQLGRMGGLRSFPEPRWNGESFIGKRLLVWPEQGLGDQLQFVRFIPRVKALGGTVVLMCAAPLRDLFRALVPDADEVVAADTPYDACDLQAPLMSLPFVLALGDELDAQRVPYLSPAGAMPDRIATMFSIAESSLRAGIVWAGQPKHQNDRNRSIPLSTIAPLFDLDAVGWYSVQKGEVAEVQLALLNEERLRSGAARITELGPLFSSFIDTSHALSQLDLVITVDTAVAHLAGAMGIPCWVLLPFNPDWRWQLSRTDTPWYPTVRLFRQRVRGDWNTVVSDVAVALEECAHDRTKLGPRLA
jgi:Flp pilus assembly protein TadD